MTMQRLATGIILLVLVGVPPARAAQPEAEKQARRSFDRAEAHFKAGLFAEALAEYQAGYDQAPLPGFLINIAQCQRRMGDLKQARNTYRKFILVAPDSPYVAEVQNLIAELDRLIESENGAAPPPGDESAGGAGQGSKSSLPPADKAPLPAAATAAAAVETNQLVASPTAPAPATASPTRWWLWGGIGAVVVAGAATTFFLLRSPGTTTLHDGTLGTLRR
jgi:hypothetical protein